MDRHNPTHVKEADAHRIKPIDLIVVNLYQFEKNALKEKLTLSKAIEFIDIGGPTMLRAAAKNYTSCAPVIDPDDYELVLNELHQGKLAERTRIYLAQKSFRMISSYDVMIADYFQESLDDQKNELPPQRWALDLEQKQPLRYGENPHQKAALYVATNHKVSGFGDVKILQGKTLSFNNFIDTDAATALVQDFPDAVAVAIIKHTNPCGAAISSSASVKEVFERALKGDPKSAFGGIVATNAVIDGPCAESMSKVFFETIAAPGFKDEAIAIFSKKKNLRLLVTSFLDRSCATPHVKSPSLQIKSIQGAFLIQTKDDVRTTSKEWDVVTHRSPTSSEADDLAFAMTLVKHVKSNAIVYAKNEQTIAVGAGQMSRIDAAQFAAQKAIDEGKSLTGAMMASDAFFPFRDCVDLAAKLGIKAIIQPGGSMRDQESIDACNEHGIAMVFTGKRHFNH